MKLLLIEDEVALSESVSDYLKQEGHICEMAHTFDEAVEKIELYSYDCMIVDINLPDGSGLDLIRKVKAKSIKSGIIIVSARDSVENRIEGLEIGADDYLTKPFHLAELNAHLKSIQRRLQFDGENAILMNEIKVLPDERKTYVHDKEINLTKKEFDLLVFFLANKNKVITKMNLAEHIWGDFMDTADSYDFIYTHMKNLRKKLLDKGSEDYIKTVYGIGYKFTTD